MTVIEGYFRRIWGMLGINKIAMVGRGMFIMRFDSMESCLKGMTGGFQFF